MTRVFLTGGTGFIGQPLTRSLLSRGWGVTGLVRRPASPQAQSLARMGAQLAAGDVTDRESMRASMGGAEIVVHNAGHYEYGIDHAGRERMQAINVQGTDNVLGLARELGVPRVVYVSSMQAFGDSGSEMRDETFTRHAPCRTAYEESKTEAHEVAYRHLRQGLPLVIVCPNAVIGANDHSAWGYFQRLYLNRLMPPVCWSPGSVFCCVDVNDLAEGIALAAEKGRTGEMYFLNGEPKSFRDHLGFWARRPGAFRPVVWLPAGLAAALFWPLEPLQRMLGLPAFISRETVRGGATNWNYSAEKAKRELGWSHRRAEEMWLGTLDGELRLLERRKGQSWVKRLEPLETVDKA
jgi:dihydroflavonol-4-reductase